MIEQYGDRDIMKLDKEGGHYMRHVNAMTSEALHDKSDIAAELAFRDHALQIERQKNQLLQKRLENAVEGLNNVAYPVRYLQEEAKREGTRLNGNVHFIMSDPTFLRDLAEDALSKDQTIQTS